MSIPDNHPAIGPEWQRTRAAYTAITDRVTDLAEAGGGKRNPEVREAFIDCANALNEMQAAAHAYRDVMARSAMPAGSWMKCSERMPENETPTCTVDVLLATDEEVGQGYLHTEPERIGTGKMYGRPGHVAVTHWMPLPQPPTSEGDRFDRKRFEQAPCYLCGYNGHGYFQPGQHACAERYHAETTASHQEKP